MVDWFGSFFITKCFNKKQTPYTYNPLYKFQIESIFLGIKFFQFLRVWIIWRTVSFSRAVRVGQWKMALVGLSVWHFSRLGCQLVKDNCFYMCSLQPTVSAKNPIESWIEGGRVWDWRWVNERKRPSVSCKSKCSVVWCGVEGASNYVSQRLKMLLMFLR